MGWFSKILRTRTEDWIFAPLGALNPILDPESWYLNVWLRSMRIVNVRSGLSKFYGTVHSYASLLHLNRGRAEFQTVTTPNMLKDQDAKNLDRVISFNHRLLGPVPYRGQDLEIEIGLFSIKSSELAGPFIDVLERMSNAAGVSYVSSAMPFVAPLKDGINLLIGGADSTILEVGLSTTFEEVRTGTYCVIRAPKGSIDPTGLRLDTDQRLVDSSGTPITDHPYLVFSIEASDRRDDWFLVPELAKAYQDLKEVAEKGQTSEATDAFAVFRRISLTSPELLRADAKRLVDNVGNQIEEVLKPPRRFLGPPMSTRLPDLNKIPLYE